MGTYFYSTTIPLGGGICPASACPQIWRVTSRDAARALNIPLQGHWDRKLALVMRELGWEPIPFRHRGKSVCGYQRVFQNDDPRS